MELVQVTLAAGQVRAQSVCVVHQAARWDGMGKPSWPF